MTLFDWNLELWGAFLLLSFSKEFSLGKILTIFSSASYPTACADLSSMYSHFYLRMTQRILFCLQEMRLL